MSIRSTGVWSRVPDLFKGLIALGGVVVVVAGVPAGLLLWVGSPLPAGMPSASEVTAALRATHIPDEFLVKALAFVCWLVWAELVASLLVEAVAYGRGRRAGTVPLAGGLQQGAARLIAGVALLGLLLATRGEADRHSEGLALAPATPVVAGFEVDEHPVATADAPAASEPAPAPRPVYEVQRRDTLWDIAERHLGDPFRWREVFALNEGRPQPDGSCMTNPDLIHPGWRFELPPDATGLGDPAAEATGGGGDRTDASPSPSPSPSSSSSSSPSTAPSTATATATATATDAVPGGGVSGGSGGAGEVGGGRRGEGGGADGTRSGAGMVLLDDGSGDGRDGGREGFLVAEPAPGGDLDTASPELAPAPDAGTAGPGEGLVPSPPGRDGAGGGGDAGSGSGGGGAGASGMVLLPEEAPVEAPAEVPEGPPAGWPGAPHLASRPDAVAPPGDERGY